MIFRIDAAMDDWIEPKKEHFYIADPQNEKAQEIVQFKGIQPRISSPRLLLNTAAILLCAFSAVAYLPDGGFSTVWGCLMAVLVALNAFFAVQQLYPAIAYRLENQHFAACLRDSTILKVPEAVKTRFQDAARKYGLTDEYSRRIWSEGFNEIKSLSRNHTPGDIDHTAETVARRLKIEQDCEEFYASRVKAAEENSLKYTSGDKLELENGK